MVVLPGSNQQIFHHPLWLHIHDYFTTSVFVMVFGSPAAHLASSAVVAVFLEKLCAIICSDMLLNMLLQDTMSQEKSDHLIQPLLAVQKVRLT